MPCKTGNCLRTWKKMPELEIHINPFMVDALIQMIETIGSNLDSVLPQEDTVPEADEDFKAIWMDGLREGQEKDCSILLHILRNKDFGKAPVTFDEENGEAMLRSCSAIRLKIQDTLLKDLSMEQLEVGEVDIHKLEAEQQRGYACYLFLATLQSLIIRELEPDLDDL